MKRYRLVREGHDEWGVADRFSGKLVMTQESFAIADQLTDALNGLPGHPYTEIGEIANSIRAKEGCVMSACGLTHARSYRSNTGKSATLPRLARMEQSCASWKEQLDKTYQSPAVTLEAALTQHAVVARFWTAHMEDLGAS